MGGATGKYRLEGRLGGGGMAEVFIGSTRGAEGFSRKVAIKRVLPGFSDNPQFSNMFISEAQLSSQLVHPNIVSVLDFDRDADRRLFLVMELVEGRDLDALLQTGVLPFSVVNHVTCEILRGLGYAHNLPSGEERVRGIIHRDVSPHNVLLSWEGSVKVSDFGIAKARAASNATASVFIKGKPAYMSPEQANGGNLDGRSDLFAVGIMLWEMLAGRRLFIGNDTRETLAQVLFAPLPWPRQHRAGIPVDLELVCMRLLDRDLEQRYATAEDAIADLTGCVDAPRAGRDELCALLVERFPGIAPQRVVRRPGVQGAHSGLGSGSAPNPMNAASGPIALPGRGGVSTPVPVRPPGLAFDSGPGAHAYGPPSAALTSPVPHAAHAAPTQQSLMNAQRAETRTVTPGIGSVPIDAPAARRGPAKPLLMVALAMLVGAGASIAVITALKSNKASKSQTAVIDAAPTVAQGPSGPTAGGGQVMPDAAPAIVAPLDAAPPPPPPPPPDAAPSPAKGSGSAGSAGPASTTTRPTATPPRKKCNVPEAAGTATLEVFVDPWATVTLNGKSLGQTPKTKAVPSGCYTLTLKNDELDKRESFTIELAPGQTKTIERSWN